ncbi:glycosyl hydrolase 115 family protein [candidate division KSB1 bacterium]|nr:glycosyl hydrolase 115 family protein [candidate division KSB1 bacterium]
MIQINKKIAAVVWATFFIFECVTLHARVDNFIAHKYSEGDFRLVDQQKSAVIYFDQNDYKVVDIAVHLLADDIRNVTGITPQLTANWDEVNSNVVIIGTIGRNDIIDDLIKTGRIDASRIDGQWESYALQVIESPTTKIQSALVIFGSDRRGTAYGVFELSKQIGVSPWYWWADVPFLQKDRLIIEHGFYSDGPPSVKFRGIFINDEDWGLKPWASKTFDPGLGDIGPKTYRRIFELLLRLRANHCWPAMHECIKPFNYYPENKQIADDYAIVMGSAHCEPLLFNNATEWNSNTMGEWRYDTNSESICDVLDRRIAENGKFENVYTVGMRGLHDAAMRGNLKLEQQVTLLEQAIADQRGILTKHINKKITDIPQVFIPYKEVLKLYNNGLKVPDDVTLMWVDDNFGYIRRLSNPIERDRSGGSGIYYHLSYLGPPHEYLWISSTAPALIWEEMTKAYQFDAREIWVANVGDIKPCEYAMSFFLDLAWDINMVNHSNISSHLLQWLTSIFSDEFSMDIFDIMHEFIALSFERKVEHLAFGEEFSFSDKTELWEDTEYSFVNYREAEKRLMRFQAISKRAVELSTKMPELLKPAYFELVYYPIVAGNYMNAKILLAQQNRWYAKQGRNMTNQLARQSQAYYDSVCIITDEYNKLLNGKWKYMMSWQQHPAGVYYKMPPLRNITLDKNAGMGVRVEGQHITQGINKSQALPCFNSLYNESHYVEIFNKGTMPFTWEASANQDWIQLSKSTGTTAAEERIWVSIDWSQAPANDSNGEIKIQGAGREEIIDVYAFHPSSPAKEDLLGVFVENAGVISIPAENYHRKLESEGITWETIPDLGLTGSSVTMFPATVEHGGGNHPDAPHLEYDIYTFNSGIIEIHTFVLPVFPINGFRWAHYSISIDDGRPQKRDISVPEKSSEWADNVRRNASKNITRHYLDKPGKHTVKLWKVDTGLVFDKIIIDFGGLKPSYLGPDETIIK